MDRERRSPYRSAWNGAPARWLVLRALLPGDEVRKPAKRPQHSSSGLRKASPRFHFGSSSCSERCLSRQSPNGALSLRSVGSDQADPNEKPAEKIAVSLLDQNENMRLTFRNYYQICLLCRDCANSMGMASPDARPHRRVLAPSRCAGTHYAELWRRSAAAFTIRRSPRFRSTEAGG